MQNWLLSYMHLLHLRDRKNKEREEAETGWPILTINVSCFAVQQLNRPYSTQDYISQTVHTAAGSSAQDSESPVPSVTHCERKEQVI